GRSVLTEAVPKRSDPRPTLICSGNVDLDDDGVTRLTKDVHRRSEKIDGTHEFTGGISTSGEYTRARSSRPLGLKVLMKRSGIVNPVSPVESRCIVTPRRDTDATLNGSAHSSPHICFMISTPRIQTASLPRSGSSGPNAAVTDQAPSPLVTLQS